MPADDAAAARVVEIQQEARRRFDQRWPKAPGEPWQGMFTNRGLACDSYAFGYVEGYDAGSAATLARVVAWLRTGSGKIRMPETIELLATWIEDGTMERAMAADELERGAAGESA